jgi:hypothetical protein
MGKVLIANHIGGGDVLIQMSREQADMLYALAGMTAGGVKPMYAVFCALESLGFKQKYDVLTTSKTPLPTAIWLEPKT